MKISSNIARATRKLNIEFTEIDRRLDGLVKEAATYVMYEIQDVPPDGTPRKTLRAVNGWNASNGPVPDWTDPGEAFLHSEPDPEAELRKIPTITEEANIANAVPYIGQLEFGSSTQAPVNFVRIAISRAVSYLDHAKLLGKVNRKRSK